MFRWCCLLLVLLLASCSDVLPEKQCDPERRCSSEDQPVCGADGQWYECGLVAACEEVAVALSTSTCGDPVVPSCPDIACDDCDNRLDRYDSDGCLVECQCLPDECPAPPTCEADGCALVDSRGDGCPTCVCEPLTTCEPFDPAACEPEAGCSVVQSAEGCLECVCDQSSECPRQFCDNYCANGYLIVDGCATCECYEPCNELPECDLACPTGNATDPATMCSESCACVADTCPEVGCRLFCEFGFRRANDGCEVCDCRGTPCTSNEGCALDETCVMDPSPHDVGDGECVKVEMCGPNERCDDGGPCGFYFRQDCCPPLTTCDASMPACAAVCLLQPGDLPRSP